jgi:hypothetical protein
MTDEHRDLLPLSFTTPIAAKLLKTTPEALASLTRAGDIQALPQGTSWKRYARGELERILGQPITVGQWLEADREHDARRAANKRHNEKRLKRLRKAKARYDARQQRCFGGCA